MAANKIADNLRRFISTNIPSIPYLEALLLLRGDTKNPWDAKRLARSLYIDDAKALSLLIELLSAGIIAATETEGTFRYQPPLGTMQEMLDSLAEVYAVRLVDVTNLVHARTSSKAKQFADAFVWRKDS